MRKETQTITDIMERSDLAALFVIDAVRKHATTVSKADPDTFTNPLLGGRKWHQTAREILSKLERRFS